MPRKRKADEDGDEEEAASQAASQAPQPIKPEIAELLATNLCRFVLLREHTRKPITRAEIKDNVMPEHKAQDRSGKIFKQVFAVANDKLREIAGLELVSEADAGAADDAADDGADAGAAASQAAASQPATQGAASRGSAVAGGARYVLVNKLADAVTVPLTETDQGRAIYIAFVEVVLAIISESQDKQASEATWVKEADIFTYLHKLGLERESNLPRPAEPEKVESLVQKRLVNEAYLRRRKQRADGDQYEYLVGARALLCRDTERAATFVENMKKSK